MLCCSTIIWFSVHSHFCLFQFRSKSHQLFWSNVFHFDQVFELKNYCKGVTPPPPTPPPPNNFHDTERICPFVLGLGNLYTSTIIIIVLYYKLHAQLTILSLHARLKYISPFLSGTNHWLFKLIKRKTPN